MKSLLSNPLAPRAPSMPDRVQRRLPVEPARGDEGDQAGAGFLSLLLLLFKLPESAPLVRFHRLQPSGLERIGSHVHGPLHAPVAVIPSRRSRPPARACRQAGGGRARDPPSTVDERAALSVWQPVNSRFFRTPPIWKNSRWHSWVGQAPGRRDSVWTYCSCSEVESCLSICTSLYASGTAMRP